MAQAKLSMLDFIEGFKYKVLTSISKGIWENKIVTKETLEDVEYLRFIENEIKVNRVKHV
jgi:hypothetical protein